MARLIFRPLAGATGSRVRIDTASGSSTPADITPVNSGRTIPGAVLPAAVDTGSVPSFMGPDGVTTLYEKQLDYAGNVTSTIGTLTGVAQETPGLAPSTDLSGLASKGSVPTYRNGAVIPPGSLDRLHTLMAQAKAGSILGEIPVYGDSTMWGQTDTSNASTGVGAYPLPQKLRALAIAAGYPDGGTGIHGNPCAASMTGADNLDMFVSSVGTWAQGFYSPLRQYSWACTSNTTNDQLVVQMKTPANGTIRINFTSNTPASGSAWSYAVDGGGPVSVAAQTSTRKTKTYSITGLSAGTHTVTVKLTSTGTAGTGNEYNFEAVGPSGVVFQNYSISGSKAALRFDNSGGMAQEAFGMGYYEDAAWTSPTTPYFAGTTARAGTPRTVIGAILALGINDQQNSSANFAANGVFTQAAAAGDAASLLEAAIGSFAELCRFAQIDGIVCIPHLLYAFNPQWSGMFRSVVQGAAASYRLATYDMQYPLGGRENYSAWGSGVHLKPIGYDAQAQGLWDNLLSA